MFEWDEAKSDANFAVRGFDFAFAAHDFDGDTLERPDERRDYAETRVIALGEAEGVVLVVAFTWRGERRRIIPAQRASRTEREVYRRAFPS